MRARSIRGYRDLEVWQKAMDLVELCYRVTRQYPITERYGLCSQSRRAAISVPANIAEGQGREHLGDYLRHLSIANGSLMELETEFEAARRLGLLSETEFTLVAKRCGEVGRLLAGLIRSLKRLWNVRRPTPGTRHPTPSNR
ncbi:MAG: diversity-generating retroelement protein bAvd family protein [Gemmatimonadetes bacterium]|nr:MAG: diversity-generating retroelement protein bAvd family protein [Gemmatimonadota bacterium]